MPPKVRRIAMWSSHNLLLAMISVAPALLFGQDAVLELAPVKVRAYCPIVKVGEYRMGQGRKGASVVADKDYIYIIGGESASGVEVNQIDRFNVHTHQLETIAKLKVNRVFHGAAIVGRTIFILGGTNGVLQSGERSSGTIARPERIRRDRDADIDPGNPLSTGARFPELYLDSVEYINLDTLEQGIAASMPVAKAFFGTAVYEGNVYVIGGKKIKGDSKANTNSVEIFDPAKRSWRTGIPMPTPRQCMAVVVDDFIIVPGGYDGRKKHSAVEFFIPKESVWKALPPLASPVSGSALVRFGKYLFLFGDYDSPDEVFIYDLSNRKSQSFSFSYTPGRHAAAVAVGNRIYVIGGATSADGPALDTIQVFASVDDVSSNIK